MKKEIPVLSGVCWGGWHRVPYLELNLLAVYCDHTRPEFHPDGEVVDGLKALVGELEKQARLADACCPNQTSGNVKCRRRRERESPKSASIPKAPYWSCCCKQTARTNALPGGCCCGTMGLVREKWERGAGGRRGGMDFVATCIADDDVLQRRGGEGTHSHGQYWMPTCVWVHDTSGLGQCKTNRRRPLACGTGWGASVNLEEVGICRGKRREDNKTSV